MKRDVDIMFKSIQAACPTLCRKISVDGDDWLVAWGLEMRLDPWKLGDEAQQIKAACCIVPPRSTGSFGGTYDEVPLAVMKNYVDIRNVLEAWDANVGNWPKGEPIPALASC